MNGKYPLSDNPNGPHRSSLACAWCIYRDGDMCTNPKSLVSTSSERRELLRIILTPVTAVYGGLLPPGTSRANAGRCASGGGTRVCEVRR